VYKTNQKPILGSPNPNPKNPWILVENKVLIKPKQYDTIRAIEKQLNSDFDVKCTNVQFHGHRYNSQSDHWIELKFYVEFIDMFSYLRLKF
jgi:acyl-ACP thioesterase